MMDLLQIARKVILEEGRAINDLAERIGPEFARAVTLIECCPGQVIVSGMGKSGYIARKIAATFVSIGVPACYVHPSEALHGDLGAMSDVDVLLLVSNSGETEEILRILSFVTVLNVPIIAVLGRVRSAIGRIADIVLDAGVKKEGYPTSTIPTTSATAALVMGDALTVALMELREFTAEDFAHNHPGGTIGKTS